MEDVPPALVGRVFLRPPRDHRTPIGIGDIDVEPGFSQIAHRDVAERADSGDLVGVDESDLLPLVARLREQRLGARQILFAIGFGAGLGLVRAAADKERETLPPPALIAEAGAQIFVLVDGQRQRLAALFVVERRVQRVRPDDRRRLNLRVGRDYDTLGLFQGRDLVVGQLVDQVDLVALQRARLGEGVRQHHELDPVDLDHLAARDPARRLGPRHVIGVLLVDHARRRVPFRGDKAERSRADRRGDRLVGVGRGVLGAPDHRPRRAERHLDKRKGPGQPDREDIVVAGFDRTDIPGERLPEHVAHHPALDRGDRVAAGDLLPVVDFEPRAQGKGVEQLVGRDGVGIHHLRPGLQVLVPREQRVVDHLPVHQGDRRGIGVRVEDFEVGMRHHPQHDLIRRRA